MHIIGFRSVPLGTRMLTRDPGRFFVTVAGVGVSVALMLFLVGVYGGVRTESNGYVAGRHVTAWVAQRNATNLVRSSSFVRAGRASELEAADGVASVTPILRLITTLRFAGRTYTAFVCGIDPAAAATVPDIAEGRGTLGAREMIVDRALARRAGLSVGDTLVVQGRPFRVSGISTGTNVIISQFTFTRLEDAQELLGFPGVVSFLLVQADRSVSAESVKATLRAAAPDLNVFTADEFTKNNLDELRGGLLPILATVALLGALVGAAVVTLLLYGSILERREDFALVKAIGAGRGFLRLLVLRQSLVVVFCGYFLGLFLYGALQPPVASLVPVLAMSLSIEWALLIAGVTLAMGASGSLLSMRKLERVYPGEVFRA